MSIALDLMYTFLFIKVYGSSDMPGLHIFKHFKKHKKMEACP